MNATTNEKLRADQLNRNLERQFKNAAYTLEDFHHWYNAVYEEPNFLARMEDSFKRSELD